MSKSIIQCFCVKPDAKLYKYDQSAAHLYLYLTTTPSPYIYRVECGNCKYTGTTHTSASLAIESWNELMHSQDLLDKRLLTKKVVGYSLEDWLQEVLDCFEDKG